MSSSSEEETKEEVAQVNEKIHDNNGQGGDNGGNTGGNTGGAESDVVSERKRERCEHENDDDEQSKAEVKEVEPKPKKIIKIRKARQQVPKRKNYNLQQEDVVGDYNIWYHKYIGSNRDRIEEREPATTRCSIMRDSGWTIGCTEKEPYFCQYFARGCCDKGAECKFLHRLPTEADQKRISITRDVFGREKFGSDRDDMGGIGSFNRECKTLYIGNLKNIPGTDMNEIVTRHFKEWGQLEYVRVFSQRCYAFVKYKLRLCAEFAKEAMSRQPLDDEEILNIRWATDDPNPMAQQRNAIDLQQQLVASLKQQGIQTAPLPFNYPKEYKIEGISVPGSSSSEELITKNQKSQQTNSANVAAGGSNPNAAAHSTQNQQSQAIDPYNYYYQYYYSYYYPQSALQDIAEQQQQLAQSQAPVKSTNKKSVPHKQTYKQMQQQNPLDYFAYIHSTFKQNKLLENEHKDENKSIDKQRKLLDSEVADPYPITEHQYTHNTQ